MEDLQEVPLLTPKNSASTADFPEDGATTGKLDHKLELYAWKDILVLASGAFCFNFGYIAFLFNLSTLYADANLVFTTLTINCAAQMLTSLFLPALLIRKWGCKTTAVIAVSSVISFSAAQFYPNYATFIPTAIILGFGNTCVWVAVSTYVSNVGLDLAAAQKKRPDIVLSTLFGVVNFVRFSGAIIGNLVPYILLNSDKKAGDEDSSKSVDLSQCGASYCSEPKHVWTPSTNQSFPDVHEHQMSGERVAIFGTFFVVGLCGPVLLLLFLNPRRKLENPGNTPGDTTGDIPNLLMATIRAMKDPKHLLLISTFLNTGILRSFASGDFSKDFVLCSNGLNDVSLAAIISNICYIGGTTIVSLLVRGFGVMGALTTTHVLCFLTFGGLFVWTPLVPMATTLLFIASAVMGAAMGAYNNLHNTSIGLLFPQNKEEGYGVYHFHYALGSMIGYAWAVGVCMNVKIWLLLVFVTVAEGTYLLLEYLLRKNILQIVVK